MSRHDVVTANHDVNCSPRISSCYREPPPSSRRLRGIVVFPPEPPHHWFSGLRHPTTAAATAPTAPTPPCTWSLAPRLAPRPRFPVSSQATAATARPRILREAATPPAAGARLRCWRPRVPSPATAADAADGGDEALCMNAVQNDRRPDYSLRRRRTVYKRINTPAPAAAHEPDGAGVPSLRPAATPGHRSAAQWPSVWALTRPPPPLVHLL